MQVGQMGYGVQNTFDIRDARFRSCVGDNRPDVARAEYGEALMDVAKRIGVRIRACRERAGMTQGELAAAAFVTRQSVGNWENGKTLPDVQSLQLVARTLGTTTDGILGMKFPPSLRKRRRPGASSLDTWFSTVRCIWCILLVFCFSCALLRKVTTTRSWAFLRLSLSSHWGKMLLLGAYARLPAVES